MSSSRGSVYSDTGKEEEGQEGDEDKKEQDMTRLMDKKVVDLIFYSNN